MLVPAIVLAAGASRRLGRPKQLVEFRGETLLERAVRIAAESGAAPVIAVLGAHAEEIRASVPLPIATVVINGEWQSGMASSIRAGLRILEPDAPGVLLLACDQPRLGVSHLRSLLASFETGNSAAIVASVYRGTRGVPAVFPRSAFARLNALDGDKGARSILLDPHCELVEVKLEGGEIDIDSPADLAFLD